MDIHETSPAPSTIASPGWARLTVWSCLMLLLRSLLAVVVLLPLASSLPVWAAELHVAPAQIVLRGQAARQQLIVAAGDDARAADVTREASYESTTPHVVAVDERGIVRPVGDGQGTVVVRWGDRETTIQIAVEAAEQLLPLNFENDIQPILTAQGCNSGACHGKQRGQNGFQLSLLGFDPNFDYHALTAEARGRRVFPAVPDQSLLLLKGSGQTPHGGGRRIEPDGEDYDMLRRWIAQGLARRQADEPVLERITLTPTRRVMVPDAQQQLIVTAHYTDGTTRDVTRRSAYQSNESSIVDVGPDGLLSVGSLPGEAAIMARYMDHLAICEVLIPYEQEVLPQQYENLPRNNFIDELVWQKLEELHIVPSGPAPDAMFLRRAYLDAIGRLPTVEETEAFLADPNPTKRERLVDELLARPEYGDYWANKWVDLLRPNPYRVGIKAVMNFDAWIRDAFRTNKPYDQFVSELVTAQGSTWRNGATTLFRDRRAPDELATMVSQLFLGVRIECAKCHQHPFESLGQEDFYSFAAYFAQVGRKGTGLSPPISGGEEIVFAGTSGSVKHPLTNEVLSPRPLFGTAPEREPTDDPRDELAAWMTSEDNDYFVRVIANRVWADLMGRGLVEPVDDLRATNPPTNGALLNALGDDFRRHQYDLKHLIRTIMTSYAYGLDSLAHEGNVPDTQNYSRSYRQRLRAEVLLDAICDITEVPESFSAMPPESRAQELWTYRIKSLFLDTFGRPDLNQDPPCERTPDTSVVQALHLMNAPTLHAKVTSDAGRAARLAASERTVDEIIEELYLLIYCRPPAAEEFEVARGWFSAEGITRRQATEDLMWALMNTPEFVFRN